MLQTSSGLIKPNTGDASFACRVDLAQQKRDTKVWRGGLSARQLNILFAEQNHWARVDLPGRVRKDSRASINEMVPFDIFAFVGNEERQLIECFRYT
jgi:hypothetical protein